VNANRTITLKTICYLANYLHLLKDREILKFTRWLQVAVPYSDRLYPFFTGQDHRVTRGTTFGDYFGPKPGKESVAPAKALALIFQCALGARQPKRDCTRCALDRVSAGKGKFNVCRRMKLKGNK
jgi:hypothetical protein